MTQPYPQYPSSPYSPGPPPQRNALAGWALGIAIAALLISGAALIFSALAAFGPGLSAFDDLPVDGTVGDLGNLAEGECFTSVTLRPETITLAPCQSSHDGEVYVRKSLGGDLGEDYPGDEITWEADEVCYDEFASYTGEIFEESAFSYAIFGPDETSWAQGDREVACAITPSRLGSLEGSARRE